MFAEYFSTNNPGSIELENVRSLNSAGIDNNPEIHTAYLFIQEDGKSKNLRLYLDVDSDKEKIEIYQKLYSSLKFKKFDMDFEI